ncbi:cadherin-23-like isoform X2 [Branchiostoma floridae]|uniref:Cadherin-23-like isoform X1 n=1 Tax=Branchiostoma floridae TaxID=7739 RepID=A0A9J7KRV1_BRAFL|nr:cadherin-23-like isoform X1 [Branchiostoma floridae]XP_035669277.1 cadherin-23-like isoform X2 [Branchiostoma floridae]
MLWRQAVVLGMVCIILRTGAQANQPPIFTQGMDYQQIPEDTAVGSTVYTLSATDADGDTLTYGVSGQVSNNLFIVDPSSGVVTLKTPLDRELTDEYQITVTVSDGTNPQVVQTPTIFITDANDNSPVFQGIPYEVSVNESDVSQTSIFRVTATDADQGIGGTVSYFLEAGDESKFEVDRPTGVVNLKEELDYEESSVYQLRIRAQDGGGSYQGTQVFQSSTTVLIVNVVDQDDQPPLFLGQPFSTQVNEDTPLGTSIITINARDGDYGIDNPIVYSTEGDDGTFSIDSITGVISLARTLDRESKTDEGGVYSFDVQARENSIEARTTNTSVRITVVDVNDQIPTFYNGTGNSPQNYFTATIPEGTSAGIPLGGLDMRVEDNDEGDNGRFTLTLDEEGSRYFEVVPSTVYGQAAVNIRVKNSRLLDYETLQSVQFKVIAREDLAAEHYNSTATVLVTLEDTNDNSPVFNQSKYDLSVAENSPDGTVVGTITATDLDSGEFAEIAYSLQGSGSEKFAVNNLTGVITVAKGDELDRETIPFYFLTLLAEDGGGRASNVQLQITLLDVNDEAPTFQRSSNKVYIQEDAAAFDEPLQVLAVDRDEGTNKVIKYSIISGNDHDNFTIDEDSGVIDLTQPLDYEALGGGDEFHLVVQAKDEGQPPLNSTTTVIVVVEDINDNDPFFLEDMVNTTVSEAAAADTLVVKLNATDEDSGFNGRIDYRIASGSKDKFYITNDGEIKVSPGGRVPLDRDLYGDGYTLIVTATDRGNPDQKTGTATVFITIEDINNKDPVFVSSEKTDTLPEYPNTTYPSKLADMPAVDSDIDSSLEYTITSIMAQDENGQVVTVGSNLFNITSKGEVWVNGELDREFAEDYVLRLEVNDTAAPWPGEQTATATLTIILQDVNDNAPKFSSDEIEQNIQEQLPIGQLLATITANDPDKGPNGEVMFSLTGTNLLAIDSSTGQIKVNSTIDREYGQWLNFTVTAKDGGNPPKSTDKSYNWRVSDTNDNDPKFEQPSYSGEVSENATVGTSVLTVTATDADFGQFGAVRYSLVPVDSNFTIHPDRGEISVDGKLDREMEEQVTLTVTATDNPGGSENNQREKSVEVTIKLLDVNDEAPTFSQNIYTEYIQEDEVAGTSIITLQAVDRDSAGPNSQIEYTILAGNEAGVFTVGRDSGIMTTLKPPGLAPGQDINVTVLASDKGSPIRSSTTIVRVKILDTNDNAPIFVYPAANASTTVLENEPVGTFVVRVLATDEDEAQNGNVTYYFDPSDEYNGDRANFTLDPISGNLTTKVVLDREEKAQYVLYIQARDAGFPPLTGATVIRVHVGDVPDTDPVFKPQLDPVTGEVVPQTLTVGENLVPGTVVGFVLNAFDADEGATIFYYIVGGDPNGYFDLNKNTGEIKTTRTFDREAEASYTLVVKASNNASYSVPGGSRRRKRDIAYDPADPTLQEVIIEIGDQNDEPPRFTKKEYTAGITTEFKFGDAVTVVTAIDPDAGNNSVVTYTITRQLYFDRDSEGNLMSTPKDATGTFNIESDTGQIVTGKVFSSDEKGYYTLNVSARDIGGQSDNASVEIYLLREDQRVKIVFQRTPDEVRAFKDEFAALLSNITGAIINVDDIQFHTTDDQQTDELRTDMFIHGVDRTTGLIMDKERLIELIDANYEFLVRLLRDYNVVEYQVAVPQVQDVTYDNLIIAIAAMAGILVISIALIATVCVCWTSRLKRELRASQAMLYSTKDVIPDLSEKDALQVPGTNQFAIDGSNPMWGKEVYVNEIAEESDSDDSLDDNEVDVKSPQAPSAPPRDDYADEEITVNLYNDEYDNYTKFPPGYANGNFILDAALKEHEDAKRNGPHRNFSLETTEI